MAGVGGFDFMEYSDRLRGLMYFLPGFLVDYSLMVLLDFMVFMVLTVLNIEVVLLKFLCI